MAQTVNGDVFSGLLALAQFGACSSGPFLKDPDWKKEFNRYVGGSFTAEDWARYMANEVIEHEVQLLTDAKAYKAFDAQRLRERIGEESSERQSPGYLSVMIIPDNAESIVSSVVREQMSHSLHQRFECLTSCSWNQTTLDSILDQTKSSLADGLRVLFRIMSLLHRQVFEHKRGFPKWDSRHRPRTLVEQTRIKLEEEIRSKPEWEKKIQNRRIVAKWKTELGEDETSELEYVIAKLRWIRENFGPNDITPAPADSVFYSDALIADEDATRLRDLVNVLEDVPDTEQDWHPESDQQVLDIVHPSLYAYVLGRSKHLPIYQKHQWGGLPTNSALRYALDTIGGPIQYQPPPPEDPVAFEKLIGSGQPSRILLADARMVDSSQGPSSSETREQMGYPKKEPSFGFGRPSDWVELSWPSGSDYLWLPADIEVSSRSDSSIEVRFLSYINGLHPSDTRPSGQLYPVLANIFARFIPMFEKSFGYDSEARLLDYTTWSWEPEIAVKDFPGQTFTGLDPILAAYKQRNDAKGVEDTPPFDELDEAIEAWREERKFKLSPGWDHFDPARHRAVLRNDVNLRDRRLQVIVKIAKMVVTPEKATYEGGSWHVEGTENEGIAATGIYYFDSENITETKLAFRESFAPFGDDLAYEQNEWDHLTELYGFGDGMSDETDRISNQPIGSVSTDTGRCVVFPNGKQHQVSGFKLVDPSKPGYRKLLVFFLIDPSRRVLSTTNVPPQSFDWWFDAVVAQPGTRFSKLPYDVLSYLRSVCEHMSYTERASCGWAMSRAEAEDHRINLMKERQAFNISTSEELYEENISLCEH